MTETRLAKREVNTRLNFAKLGEIILTYTKPDWIKLSKAMTSVVRNGTWAELLLNLS